MDVQEIKKTIAWRVINTEQEAIWLEGFTCGYLSAIGDATIKIAAITGLRLDYHYTTREGTPGTPDHKIDIEITIHTSPDEA